MKRPWSSIEAPRQRTVTDQRWMLLVINFAEIRLSRVLENLYLTVRVALAISPAESVTVTVAPCISGLHGLHPASIID